MFVERIPVLYLAKCLDVIEAFTCGAEFMAIKTAIEEVSAIHYMLSTLGIKVTQPFHILVDN